MKSLQYENLKEIDRPIHPHIASNLPYETIVRRVLIERVIIKDCIRNVFSQAEGWMFES